MLNWTIGILLLPKLFFQSPPNLVNDTYQAALVIYIRVVSEFFFFYQIHKLSLSIDNCTMKVSLKSM